MANCHTYEHQRIKDHEERHDTVDLNVVLMNTVPHGLPCGSVDESPHHVSGSNAPIVKPLTKIY